jgi:hypothetical protein
MVCAVHSNQCDSPSLKGCFETPMRLGSGKAVERRADHGDVYKGLSAFRQDFVVLAPGRRFQSNPAKCAPPPIGAAVGICLAQ